MRTLFPLFGSAALAACSPPADNGAPNDATVPLETPANTAAVSVRPKPATPPAMTAKPVDSHARPIPADVKMFGAWAVACDNGATCTAVSMAPDDAAIAELSLAIERAPTADAPPSITIGTPGIQARHIALAIDGRTLATGTPDQNRRFTITGPVATTLAKALANGTALTARIDGKPVPVVITGAAAALRYADAAQGRADTPTAIVAIGTKPMPPVLSELPTIVVARRPNRAASPPFATLVVAMRKYTGCAADDFGPVSSETVALDAATDLVLFSCGSGAYNTTFRPLIVRGEKFSDAPFDLAPQFGEPGAKPALVNAGYDPKTGRLTSYAKGRGIGDCGVGQDFVWDGTRFRLAEMRVLGECRGAITWPTVWRATARSE